jgi:hypothetical protein
MVSAFQFRESRSAPPLPSTYEQLQQAQWEATTLPSPTFPGAEQTPPTQEPGKARTVPPSQGQGSAPAASSTPTPKTTPAVTPSPEPTPSPSPTAHSKPSSGG